MSPDGFTKPLPEEKLLKLIRGTSASHAAAAVSPQVAAVGAAVAAPAFRSGRLRALPLPWPRLATVMLSTILAVEILYLIVEAAVPMPVITVPKLAGENPAQPTAESLPDMPSLAQSATDTLFTASPEAAPSQGGASREPLSEPAQALAARLSLMGIVAGNPAQAILEDSKTGKSYFVSIGQSTVDGAVLEAVLDNRVVLSVGDERFELSL